MPSRGIALGKTGEDLACRELDRRGNAIVARRYRRRVGEVEIIARGGQTLVFVEMKARGDQAFGDPADTVTAMKRWRIVEVALDCVIRHRLITTPCRFDVVSIG